MRPSLLSRVLNDDTLRSKEAIDEAPLDELEHLIAEGPRAGLPRSRVHVALVRRAQLCRTLAPIAFPPSKAALFAQVSEGLPEVLRAARARDPYGRRRLPDLEAARAALDPRPCSVAQVGALLLIEEQQRLAGEPALRPVAHHLVVVSDVLAHCAPLLAEPRLGVMDTAADLPSHPWNTFGGKGVGAALRRELPNQRAQHMRMGLHPDGRSPGPELIGEVVSTVIACA
ncbi:MAG: hypothetical protein H6702_07075 [Myxococcales bacterium]|nr:hypothetical protein [Myxococcales bacterium]